MFRRLPHNLRRPRPEDMVRLSDNNPAGSEPSESPNDPPGDEPSSQPSTPTSFPRRPTDVLGSIHWLQRASKDRFPNELVKLILYHADYDCIHFRASHNKPDRRFSTGKETPLQPYLESSPLKYLTAESASERGRVRRVTVKATGHDQGWCQNHEGGSWTWFELGKKNADKAQQRGPEWARNAMAKEEPQDHELIYDAERPEAMSQEIRAWVEGLQNGDIVSIVPMARFSGWSCSVLKASIDVEVEVWW